MFGTLRARPTSPATAAEIALSNEIMGYWTRFASTGDPNGGSAPAWPRYATAADQNQSLGVPSQAVTGLKKSKCDQIDAMFP